jgi:S-formylglutathione hydrolase
MSGLELVSQAKSFGGWQRTYKHSSDITGTSMRFSIYLPPQAERHPCPVLWFLSGLTCTEENATVKSGFQRRAAEHGLIVVVPDTSPRGAAIPGEDDATDFGTGAGFYVDATEAPWSKNYRMYSYVAEELPALIAKQFPNARPEHQGIMGHSMGGHGALVVGLRQPERIHSISAFAPICSPSTAPWGQKAFAGYLGAERTAWNAYDAVQLLAAGRRANEILVDQGLADPFLETQLQPERLRAACASAGQPLRLHLREGYDHSYFFIASFIDEHIDWHAGRLTVIS